MTRTRTEVFSSVSSTVLGSILLSNTALPQSMFGKTSMKAIDTRETATSGYHPTRQTLFFLATPSTSSSCTSPGSGADLHAMFSTSIEVDGSIAQAAFQVDA